MIPLLTTIYAHYTRWLYYSTCASSTNPSMNIAKYFMYHLPFEFTANRKDSKAWQQTIMKVKNDVATMTIQQSPFLLRHMRSERIAMERIAIYLTKTFVAWVRNLGEQFVNLQKRILLLKEHM